MFWDRNLLVTATTDVSKFDFEQLRSNNLPSCVEYSAKDFKIIQEQSAKVGLKLPLATVYLQLLQSCIRNGESLQDNAIIREAILRGDYGPSIPTVS